MRPSSAPTRHSVDISLKFRYERKALPRNEMPPLVCLALGQHDTGGPGNGRGKDASGGHPHCDRESIGQEVDGSPDHGHGPWTAKRPAGNPWPAVKILTDEAPPPPGDTVPPRMSEKGVTARRKRLHAWTAYSAFLRRSHNFMSCIFVRRARTRDLAHSGVPFL